MLLESELEYASIAAYRGYSTVHEVLPRCTPVFLQLRFLSSMQHVRMRSVRPWLELVVHCCSIFQNIAVLTATTSPSAMAVKASLQTRLVIEGGFLKEPWVPKTMIQEGEVFVRLRTYDAGLIHMVPKQSKSTKLLKASTLWAVLTAPLNESATRIAPTMFDPLAAELIEFSSAKKAKKRKAVTAEDSQPASTEDKGAKKAKHVVHAVTVPEELHGSSTSTVRIIAPVQSRRSTVWIEKSSVDWALSYIMSEYTEEPSSTETVTTELVWRESRSSWVFTYLDALDKPCEVSQLEHTKK